MTSEEWMPNKETIELVMLELVSADSPVRFKELLTRCKTLMSRETMVRSLKQLEQDRLILRHRHSSKFVEYEPNPKHSAVIQARSDLEKWRQTIGLESSLRYEDLATAPLEGLEKMDSVEKRRHVETTAYLFAMELSDIAVRRTFQEALMDSGTNRLQSTILVPLFEQALQKQRSELRQCIGKLFKLDKNATQRGFDKWLKQANPVATKYVRKKAKVRRYGTSKFQ